VFRIVTGCSSQIRTSYSTTKYNTNIKVFLSNKIKREVFSWIKEQLLGRWQKLLPKFNSPKSICGYIFNTDERRKQTRKTVEQAKLLEYRQQSLFKSIPILLRIDSCALKLILQQNYTCRMSSLNDRGL